jgi:hypothetical protein
MSTSAVTQHSTEKPGIKPRPLRRLSLELFAVIALKIALLMLIWWFLFAPHAKPDTSPQAIAHLLAPTPPNPSAGHP